MKRWPADKVKRAEAIDQPLGAAELGNGGMAKKLRWA